MIDFNKTIHSKHVILRPMQLGDFNEMKALTKDEAQWYYFTANLSKETILKE